MLNCKKCGKEIPNDSIVCPYCGKNVNGKNNKKKVKSIISIVLIVLAIIVIAFIGINYINDKNELTQLMERSSGSTTSSSSKKKDKEEKATEENNEDESITSKYQKKYSLTEYKALCKTIPYKDLSRTPDNYLRENLYFKGKVIQVLEDTKEGMVQLRIDTKKSDYEYIENDYTDDTIYVIIDKYDKNNRILEDDIIEIWGAYTGIFSYEAVMGSRERFLVS